LQDDVKEVQSRLSKMMAAFKGKVTFFFSLIRKTYPPRTTTGP
jgi:hypothetical protein